MRYCLYKQAKGYSFFKAARKNSIKNKSLPYILYILYTISNISHNKPSIVKKESIESITLYFTKQFKRSPPTCIPIKAKPCISSKRSFVYHQHEVLYIIKPQEYTLRAMRYTFGDEMHAVA